MKLSNFLYNLHDFNLLVDEQPSMTETVKSAWENLYNQYEQLGIVFDDNNRDSEELSTLMRTILEFVLDNFRYFNYCFDYTIDERLSICPRLTVANQTIIYSDLVSKYLIFPEPIEWLDDAYTKLDALYPRVVSGGADWSSTAWKVKFIDDTLGWYIIDDENDNLIFSKRQWNEESEDYEFIDIIQYEAKHVNDLITYVTDYVYDYEIIFDNKLKSENVEKFISDLKEKHSFDDLYEMNSFEETNDIVITGNTYEYLSEITLNDYINELEFTADVKINQIKSVHGGYYWDVSIKNICELDGPIIDDEIDFADTLGLPEIVNIVFDKDATIAKADGDTILVATMSNDDELTFYVSNSGDIEFIEENGIDACDKLMGKYDTEILEYFNANQDEILVTFDDMNVEENSENLNEKVSDLLNTDLENFGVGTSVISDYFLDVYNLSRTQPNSTMFRITSYVGESLNKDIIKSLSTIGIKPISIKRGTTSRRAEFHEYFVEIDFTNPTANGITKTPTQKIKYTAIDKKTYDTDSSGLGFEVEINGVKAKGFWRPTGTYNPGGVDVDELYYDDNKFKTITIFAGGGGNRHYEMYGAPKKLDKQPKNLRFTGEYYSTLELGDTFKKKILEALAGNNTKTQLTDEFLKFFKLK